MPKGGTMFDNNSPIPLYLQLKDTIKQAILSGEYKEHQKIPAESEFEKQYKVSRITVRRAVSELVKEGYLVKQPGKGTFVTHPKLEHKFDCAQSFSKNVAKANYSSYSQILSTEVLLQDQIVEDFSTSTKYPYKEYYCVAKLRFVNDMPVILEYNYFPLPKMKAVVSFNHSESLFKNLKQILNISKLYFVDGVFSIANSTRDIALQLNLVHNSPVVYIRQAAVDDDHNLLYFGKQIINSDSYIFKIPKQEVLLLD